MVVINTYLAYVPLPEALDERLDEYAKQLKDKQLDVLSIPRLTPHVTLMRMNCEAAEEADIVDGLNDIEHEPVRFEPAAIKKFSKSALALKMKETEAIQGLHDEVADVFANRQVSPRRNVKPEYQDRVETIQRLGSPFFGEYFNPHMTIGYTGDSVDEDDLPLPSETDRDVSFETTEIVLSKKEQGSGRPYEEVGRFNVA